MSKVIAAARTRYGQVGPKTACLILAITAATVAWGLVGPQDRQPSAQRKGPGDFALHRIIVEDIRSGQPYYEAYGAALREYGYPTMPMVHWRPPLLLAFLAILPSFQIARVLLLSLVALTTFLWIDTIMREYESRVLRFLGCIVLVPTFVTAYPMLGTFCFELWAGVLIAFSLAIHGRHRPLSIISGVLALSIRELALPFVVVMAVIAAQEKRWRETLAWTLGVVAVVVYLAIHWSRAMSHVLDGDPVWSGWIRSGGWPFVLSTASWALFGLAPHWLMAVLLPLSLVGLAGWSSRVGLRVTATVFLYVVAFAVAGKSCNHYWGLMYAPLIPLGWAYAGAGLGDLAQELRGPGTRQGRRQH